MGLPGRGTSQDQGEAMEISAANTPRKQRTATPSRANAGSVDATTNKAIASAKQGDRDAIRYLYVRYSADVHRYVRTIVRNDHDAEDVTQQVFIKLMRQIGKYEQREVPFSAWIMRVAHNLTIDYMRRQRAVPVEEVRLTENGADETRHDRARDLRDALAALPDEQREVLIMRHFYGLTPGEIAVRMGKTEGSIHGLHHRGRGALRAALTDLGRAPATV